MSGIGSWPGNDARSAIEAVAEILGGIDAVATGIRGMSYVPELPARGPGADMIGRSACLLSELAIDLTPSGWRLVDRAGVDASRAVAFWRRDRDQMAEVFDGWDGPLKISFVGPWTMTAHLRLARGERVVGDLGAAHDVAQSLAEGIVAEVGRWRSVLPGARWVVQLDEPSLPAVLAGSLPTSSGYRRHRPVGADEAGAQLRAFVDVVRAGVMRAGAGSGEEVVVHCCAGDVPFGLLQQAGADAVAVDTSLLGTSGWEACAELLESGLGLWAGMGVPRSERVNGADMVAPVRKALGSLGLGVDVADRLTLAPACGLAGTESLTHAAAVQSACVDAARHLRDELSQ